MYQLELLNVSNTALFFLFAAAFAEEEYIFDEEAEEAASSHVPKFTSQSVTKVVKEGDTVTLPCLVDKLGKSCRWSSCGLRVSVRYLPSERS